MRPAELRYYLVQAHYRSLLEFSEDALDEAAAAYQRIERFVLRAARWLGRRGGPGRDDGEPADLPVSFRSAMDDDLAVPAALAAVHACVRDGNQALAASDKAAPAPAWSGSGPCSACSASIRSRPRWSDAGGR